MQGFIFQCIQNLFPTIVSQFLSIHSVGRNLRKFSIELDFFRSFHSKFRTRCIVYLQINFLGLHSFAKTCIGISRNAALLSSELGSS